MKKGWLLDKKTTQYFKELLLNQMEELLEKAKCQYEEAYGKLATLADREKESIIGKKERLKKALDAGVEVLKQEKTGALQA